MKKTYLATAVAALFVSPITTAIAADALLDDVVVSSSRSEQRSFDAPGSIQSVNRAQIENGGPQINLSESLVGVPGINAANRNNYAQDLQVSIRGYGARAPFGVRGVKMFIDGLPASFADGQGQTSQFALTSADRIEVLKGPISSLYGNASGGVLQVFTRSPGEKPELILADTIGSYGLNHKNIQYSEKRGDVGVVIDSSNFKSNGFRDYSSVEREHLNAKLIIETERGKLGILANYLDNKFAQEPGSRTLSEYQSDPYGAVSDNKNRGYGKSFTQGIYGFTFDGKLDNDNSYGYRVYSGDRKLNNPGGTLFVIDRKIMGGAVNFSTKTNIGSVPVKMTSGLEYDQIKDYRLGYSWSDSDATWASSFSRRENNMARSLGGFLQSEWLLSDQYTGLFGLRYTNVKLEVEDFYPVSNTNPDSSGGKKFVGVSPVAGLTYHLNQNSNVYFQIGRGFETPTLSEVLYTTTSTSSTNKFDHGVASAKTLQSEFGYKWRNQNLSKFDIAVFHARTSNDIVPYAIRPIGSTWTNADTSKFGLEISAANVIAEKLIFRAAFTAMDAKYDQSTYGGDGSLVASAGNKVPGVPAHQLYADLAWRSHSWLSKPKNTYTEFGVDLRSTGKIYVDSRNSYSVDSVLTSNANTVTTNSYYLIGAKASHRYVRGPHNLTFFGRLDNIFDKKYVGSVVVNQESGKYYEPGMPRNWIVGLKYSLAMN